ncbi:ABC transporter substrate-binding protein [Marinivivus vitaminiproducens]|uniref:ABC transporter substrate-binding protein n=1 Tax=Marinivivus vitaminiproducens TaxID=3035935 RepID=UPI0027997B07|nr:ABC transporter substrate-binding protein [Geminicoccaceae bacterium SCSIO 64248]
MTHASSFRRRLAAAVLLAVLAGTATAARADWPVTVTDATGREVTVPKRPERILLGSGFNLVALSLIHPDPVGLLAGWTNDLLLYNTELYESFRARFPALADVPVVSTGGPGTFSTEMAITVEPDLAILAAWQDDAPEDRLNIERMTEAGIPVVVVDFNHDPLSNTAPGMRLLGRVLGREEQAEAFAGFYEAHLEHIRSAMAERGGTGPSVLLEAFPEPDTCCWAYGGTGMGEFLTLLGSRPVGADRLPPQGGELDAEFVLSVSPEVYIATGMPDGGRLRVGPGVETGDAVASLEEAVASPVRASMAATQAGRVHALWNFFNAVPLNILALEAMASWTRPDVFPDLDPAATLSEINARFAAVPFDGTYWTSLGGPR